MKKQKLEVTIYLKNSNIIFHKFSLEEDSDDFWFDCTIDSLENPWKKNVLKIEKPENPDSGIYVLSSEIIGCQWRLIDG